MIKVFEDSEREKKNRTTTKNTNKIQKKAFSKRKKKIVKGLSVTKMH